MDELIQLAPYSFRGIPKIQCDGKVDVVYTYVNGSDPTFIHEKAWYQSNAGLKMDKLKAMAAQRSRDNEELRFSLRALFENMPFVNNVYIITNTVPGWLDIDHPNVNIV